MLYKLLTFNSHFWHAFLPIDPLFANADDTDDDKLTSDDVIVNLDDFKVAALKFVPSINKSDMEYFNKLRANYSLEQ